MTDFPSNHAVGGKAVYGASVGILMLDARFPRIPGDMGNAMTWPFPVHYKIVRGANPNLVVRNGAKGLLDQFVEAGRELVENGADGITTNCGFLSLFQDELADALGVPVATSSLMQVPMIKTILPSDRKVGIVTISAETLTEKHLTAARVPLDTPVIGTENRRHFTNAILDSHPSLDPEASLLDMIDATRDLLEANPAIGAILLECTNMVPYAADLRRIFGLPVFSIYSFVQWFQAGLMPQAFDQKHYDTRPQHFR
ncbi:aspartate/glutamate racemase family protein [Kiloniella sp. b19]|uniref:aspartate/glutamate racemase family protein n=1 Tax=Kiloniella sp. GXU_MW_B19 TaxID=3141326 RepID=UPI0031DBC654